MPAAGFAIGDMTLTDCLESNGLLPAYATVPDLFVIAGEDLQAEALALASRARKGDSRPPIPSSNQVLESNSRKPAKAAPFMP